MQYRTLGKTGIKVSPYCLGAMMLGGLGNPDHDEGIRIIHKALDTGINFIDTADRYSRGESEEIVGKALKGRREHVVLATKVHGPMGDDPNEQGNSRRWITRAVEGSLRRLQTDYIDLYQIHRPAPDTDIEETLSVLTDLMREGKVRAIGASTFPASEIVEAQWVAERRGLARFRTEQPPYSILDRSIEREVLPVCEKYGMGVMVWSPLSKGLLTGRYRKGQRDARQPARTLHAQADVERAQPGCGRAADPAGGRGGAVADAHGDGLRDRAPRRHLGDPRAADDGASRRTSRWRGEVRLSDEILDRIDAIVPPGTDVGINEANYNPPAVLQAGLRRRPASERSAA
jgi:aryl-alcohol dehydrogenase-like predicted oxidoreductase